MSGTIYTTNNTAKPIDDYLLLAQAVATGITAGTTQTQAGATALSASYAVHSVDTVGTGGDGVKLPLAVAGLDVTVINSTAATSMQVYGSGTDTINNVATATGVAQAGAKSARYVCTTSAPAGKWFRILSA